MTTHWVNKSGSLSVSLESLIPSQLETLLSFTSDQLSSFVFKGDAAFRAARRDLIIPDKPSSSFSVGATTASVASGRAVGVTGFIFSAAGVFPWSPIRSVGAWSGDPSRDRPSQSTGCDFAGCVLPSR